MTDHSPEDCYVRNPDVVLREEEPDGGLLFNPDTDQIKVINATGLFIWKLCDDAKDLNAIADAIQSAFDQVPDKDVIEQAQAFLEELAAGGFMGRAVC